MVFTISGVILPIKLNEFWKVENTERILVSLKTTTPIKNKKDKRLKNSFLKNTLNMV
jgi:hypothetical protein